MAYRNKNDNFRLFSRKKTRKDHKIKNPQYVSYIRKISLKFETAITVSITIALLKLHSLLNPVKFNKLSQ